MISKFFKGKDNSLTVLIALLVGIVIGFLIAPIKKGVIIGSYNGNYHGIDKIPNDKTLKNIDD